MKTFIGAIGVPHYTKNGKLYTGEMHKDSNGRLMTGKFHTANSQFLFHNKNGIGAINGDVLIGGIGNVSKELKYIYKASDCSDKSDCLIAIEQVKDVQKRYGYTPATRFRLRSLENRLKDF